jgi:hypothetical protein
MHSTSQLEPARSAPDGRRGAALLMALFAIVVLATIISGAMFVSQQGFRASRNTLVEQRAFQVAEYGLNAEVSNWDRSRNLPPPTGMAVGDTVTTRIYVAAGDTARVAIKRVSDLGFWVVSEGHANIGSMALESARQTGAYVRVAYPAINPKGAITSAGNVRIQGAGEANGYSTSPTGWSQCASLPNDTVAAVVVGPTGTVTSGPTNITSTPGVVHDSAAADSNTYVRYGTESWNSLTANADIKLPGGVYTSDIEPIGNDSTCFNTLALNPNWQLNWGEPLRSTGYIKGCSNYFPIIYVQTSLKIAANARGQGILLVNGDLEVQGTLDFYGIVIVRDDILKSAGTARITGAVFAANLSEVLPTSWLTGDQDVMYSRCAIESALRGSGILVRAKERHWAQIF